MSNPTPPSAEERARKAHEAFASSEDKRNLGEIILEAITQAEQLAAKAAREQCAVIAETKAIAYVEGERRFIHGWGMEIAQAIRALNDLGDVKEVGDGNG